MPISIVAGKINNIQYEKYGSDENNVILFIHGGVGGIYTFITGKLHCQKVGICSAESKTPMYASLINKLVKGNNYSVLAYDRRGCGNNRINIGNVNEWFTMEDCVNDIFTLLKHCNYLRKNIHVIGTSAGGPIAMHLCLKHSSYIKSLILLNTTADLSKTSKNITYFKNNVYPMIFENPKAENKYYIESNMDERMRNSLLKDIEERNSDYIPEKEHLNTYDVVNLINSISKDVMRDIIWKSQNRNLSIYFNDDVGIKSWDLTNIPTCIIHGSKDDVVPYTAGMELGTKIIAHNNSSFHTINGFGHGVAESEECQEIICDFLDNHRGGCKL